MAAGITLNGRFIAWENISGETGKTRQETAALKIITDWLQGALRFTAFTSGSTGGAREIVFDRDKATLSARRTVQFFGLSDQDHAFVCMDTEKIAGKMMVIRALEANMDLTVVEPMRKPDWHKEAYTFTALAPVQLGTLLSGDFPRTLKCILVGGAPVDLKLAQQINRLQIPAWETFGMTETLSHIAVRKISGDHPFTPFQLIHPMEIRTDARGCLELKGDITGTEWLTTNDCVEIQDSSHFRWLGRVDFIINSGGIKIQPEQVERTIADVMAEHGITEYFVHGFPHPEYGEAAVLIVKSTKPLDHAEILTKTKNVTPRYMNPLKVAEASQVLYGPTGKTDRPGTAALLSPLTF